MDFIFSKLMNRTSPTPQSLKPDTLASSQVGDNNQRDESVNTTNINDRIVDIIQSKTEHTNHSSGNQQDSNNTSQLKENAPVTNKGLGTSAPNQVLCTAESKAMQILKSTAVESCTTHDLDGGIIENFESNKIGILRLDSDHLIAGHDRPFDLSEYDSIVKQPIFGDVDAIDDSADKLLQLLSEIDAEQANSPNPAINEAGNIPISRTSEEKSNSVTDLTGTKRIKAQNNIPPAVTEINPNNIQIQTPISSPSEENKVKKQNEPEPATVKSAVAINSSTIAAAIDQTKTKCNNALVDLKRINQKVRESLGLNIASHSDVSNRDSVNNAKVLQNNPPEPVASVVDLKNSSNVEVIPNIKDKQSVPSTPDISVKMEENSVGNHNAVELASQRISNTNDLKIMPTNADLNVNWIPNDTSKPKVTEEQLTSSSPELIQYENNDASIEPLALIKESPPDTNENISTALTIDQNISNDQAIVSDLQENKNNIEIPTTNLSLNDILQHHKKDISAGTSQPMQSQQQHEFATPPPHMIGGDICETKTCGEKPDNVKQSSVGILSATATGAITENHNSKSISDQLENITKQPQQQQIQHQQSSTKAFEENINPFENRRFDEASSFFSTPDSISPNETFTESPLPDIINKLPTISISSPTNNQLNISLLADHLNVLHVNVLDDPNNGTITKSSGSPGNISSDDELFAECQSFPATANNSTTDLHLTSNNDVIRIDSPNALLNETHDLSNNNGIEEYRDIKEPVVETSVSEPKTNQDKTVSEEAEIVLNETLHINTPDIKITPVTPDGSLLGSSFNIESQHSSEPDVMCTTEPFEEIIDHVPVGNCVPKIEVEQDTFADSLEFIHTEQMVAAMMEENETKSPNQIVQGELNNSAQWVDIVSNISSDQQENLDHSHIELLNTSPNDMKDSDSTQSSDELGGTNTLEKPQQSLAEDNTATINDSIVDQNVAKDGIKQIDELVNTVKDQINLAASQELEPNKQVHLDANTILSESNLSSSRHSLNDTEIMHINQNTSKTLSYSLNTTIECNALLNKTQSLPARNSISPLNETHDVISLNSTQNVSMLNATNDAASFNKTNEILNNTNCTVNQMTGSVNLDSTQNLSATTSILEDSVLGREKEQNQMPSLNQTQDMIPIENIPTLNTTVEVLTLNKTMDVASETNIKSQLEEFNASDKCNVEVSSDAKETDKFMDFKAFDSQTQKSDPPLPVEQQNLDSLHKVASSVIAPSVDDFEPMDVDINSPDKSQTKFEEMNSTFKKPKIPLFGEPPSVFGTANHDDQFKSVSSDNIDMVFQSCDFDFLSKRGNNTVADTRKDSLLLRFDPLLGKPVPVTTYVQNHSTIQEEEDAIATTSAETNKLEVDFDTNILMNVPRQQATVDSNSNAETTPVKPINKKTLIRTTSSDSPLVKLEEFERIEKALQGEERDLAEGKMSVDVIQNNIKIENDIQSNENLNCNMNSNEKHDLKMEDLEKKIKNEVLKTEDIEKKLKDAEQREEALLKRITEKDKTISKMGGVIEAYEKAIAELIAEKEQITQNYDKQMEETKSERDVNKQHLESLESTFTDLHSKYERSKQLLAKLKASEEELQAEKKKNLENLGLQEQRYEKMKNHAMQQLEIANNKLEHQSKNHHLEITKLKALLKKEEIARSSINEQLIQKTKENEELVKICDELINGGSTS